jgi:lysophospholipase L1-like esterase
MKIKNNPEFYHGVLNTEEVGDYVRLRRFTDAEMRIYSINEGRAVRAGCAAGVSVKLITDAKQIRFDIRILGLARNCGNFGYSIDGYPQKPVIVPADKPGDYTAEISLDGNLHKVTVYMPHLIEFLIKDIDVSDCTVCKSAEPKKTVYFAYGDSITQGMEARDPASIYPVLTAEALDAGLYNFGVGGAAFRPEKIEPNGIKPDIVTAAYGINDWLSANLTPDIFRRNVSGFCERMVEFFPGAKLYVISPFWYIDKTTERSLGTYYDVKDMIRETCGKFAPVRFIDGEALVPQSHDYFFDTVHPNELGFARIALRLVSIIRGRYKTC